MKIPGTNLDDLVYRTPLLPETQTQWVFYVQPHVVTLRQWFDLLADIFGEERCTPFDQMELLMCIREQGFEL